MNRFITRACNQYGQPELVIEYEPDGVIQDDVAHLAATLEQMVRDGARFEPDQSLALGWSVVWFVSCPDGCLGFEEPDFRSMPVQRVPGLTSTIKHLRLQKDIVESVLPADQVQFPSLRNSCTVCKQVTETGGFVMERADPQEPDSGWFIGCLDPAHRHDLIESIDRMSLYEAVSQRRLPIVPWLALPAGTLVCSGDQGLAIQRHGQSMHVRPGSLLDRLVATAPR